MALTCWGARWRSSRTRSLGARRSGASMSCRCPAIHGLLPWHGPLWHPAAEVPGQGTGQAAIVEATAVVPGSSACAAPNLFWFPQPTCYRLVRALLKGIRVEARTLLEMSSPCWARIATFQGQAVEAVQLTVILSTSLNFRDALHRQDLKSVPGR